MTEATHAPGQDGSTRTMPIDPALARAFELVPTGILVVSLGGVVQWVNHAAADMLGRQATELVGARTADFAPDGQLDPTSPHLQELALGHRTRVSSGLRCRSPHGDALDVRAEISIIREASEHPSSLLVVLTEDVDGRVAGQALQRALSLQQATFDAAGDGFLVTDLDENAVTCNGQFMSMWKLDPLHITSWDRVLRMPRVLDQFRDANAFLDSLDQLLETPDAATFRMLELSDGRVFELHGTPRFIDGKTVGRVFAFRDISGRVRAEQALRQSQEQLVQAQKMEAVGRLAGGVAHDFNNLLTVISSYVHLIRVRRQNGPALEEALGEIEKASDGAAELTRQLLAFSRKQILEPKVLDLNALLTELSRMMRRLLGDDTDLEMNLGSDLGLIRADRNQLQQAVLNLVVNARDAMTTGGRLCVSTTNHLVVPGDKGVPVDAHRGPHVLLAVTDDGIGMDAATVARVFEPFFTTKEAGRGTGLGLATVYGMVRQSGGFVTVESVVGQGTTFVLGFPHVDAELDRISAAPDEHVKDGHETILLVEDSPDVRRLAQTILESRGYVVVTAGDPLDALRRFEADPRAIDLVLCDVMMPKMDGRRLVESMRRVWPDVKVLFMSGFTDTSTLPSVALSPRTDFIPKPFTPDRLARKIRSVLDGT